MNSIVTSNYLNVLGQINLDDLHIQQSFEYYQKRYQDSPFAKQFVANNCRIDNEFITELSIGYCDRTMGKNIPKAKSPQGAEIRGSLQRCGLVRPNGS